MLDLTQSFDSRIRRTTHNGETYYSLVDIMAVFTESIQDARKVWGDTKSRLIADGFDVSENIRHIRLTDKTGKRKQKTDCATAETCLRIIQSIASPKAEPIRQWLAQVGHERLEETDNPELGIQRAQDRALTTYEKRGKDAQWIAGRLSGIQDRRAFTDALNAHVANITGAHYGMATNKVYQGLWGRTANELKQQMDLPKSANLRDHQPTIAVYYQALTEITIAAILGKEETVTPQKAMLIIEKVATMLGVQATELGKLTGIDPATGNPLLSQ